MRRVSSHAWLLAVAFLCTASLASAACDGTANDGCEPGFFVSTTGGVCSTCPESGGSSSTTASPVTPTPTSSTTISTAGESVACNLNLPTQPVACQSNINLAQAFSASITNCPITFTFATPCSAATIVNNTYLIRTDASLCQTVTCSVLATFDTNCGYQCSPTINNQITYGGDNTAPVVTDQSPYPTSLESCAQLEQVILDVNNGAAWITAGFTDDCSGVAQIDYNITGSGGCGTSLGTTLRRYVSDACGNTAQYTSVYTVVDVAAPMFVDAPPPPTTFACYRQVRDAPFLTAIDNATCGMLSGSSSTTLNVGSTVAATNVQCLNRQQLTYVWTASDTCGNAVSVSQVVTVDDREPPTLVLGSIPPLQCNSDLSRYVVAQAPVDNCDSVMSQIMPVVEWVNVTFPSTVPDNSSRLCINSGSGDLVYTVADTCGNHAEIRNPFTILDTIPPVLESAPPASVDYQCAADVPSAGPLIANDNCLGRLSIPLQGEIQTPFTAIGGGGGVCPNHYTLTRTWMLDDGCSELVNVTSVINVADTRPPQWNETQLPEPVVKVQCARDVPPAPSEGLKTVDNCDGASVAPMTETVRRSTKCKNALSITRQWRASDQCGNEALLEQRIDVADTIAPELYGNHSNWAHTCLWPPNNKYACFFNVTQKIASAWKPDNCGEPVKVFVGACQALDCDSEDGSKCSRNAKHRPGRSDKTIQPACAYIPDKDVLCMRAELATGSAKRARLYRATVTASDECGNTSPLSIDFMLPGIGIGQEPPAGKPHPCSTKQVLYLPPKPSAVTNTQLGSLMMIESVEVPISVSAASSSSFHTTLLLVAALTLLVGVVNRW